MKGQRELTDSQSLLVDRESMTSNRSQQHFRQLNRHSCERMPSTTQLPIIISPSSGADLTFVKVGVDGASATSMVRNVFFTLSCTSRSLVKPLRLGLAAELTDGEAED